MRQRARSFGVFTLLRILLTPMLLLFGLYAWAFLVTAETLKRIHRRIKDTPSSKAIVFATRFYQ